MKKNKEIVSVCELFLCSFLFGCLGRAVVVVVVDAAAAAAVF